MHLRLITVPLLLAGSGFTQSPWSPPTAVTTLKSTAADSGPNLSFDGLTVHFASFRSGDWEIYTASRPAPGAAWTAPTQVTALGGTGTDDQPFLAVGDLEIWFASNRAGGAGGFDILRSTRAGVAAPWNPPTFVTELNSSGSESAFSVTADGLEAFVLSTGWGAPAAPNNAIFRATRAATNLPFGTPTLVTELANTNTHRDCEIAADGLTIVYTEFVSPRLKVLVATRPDRVSPFGAPVVWTEFDTVGTATGVVGFSLAATGDEALLAAGFAAAAGGQELMSTRRSVPYGAGCGGAAPLALAASVPLLGSSWDFTTTAIDPVSPLAITFFGLTATTIPLTPLGAPGCSAHVDTLLTSLGAASVGGSATVSIVVPAAPALTGFALTAQSACLTLGNTLGIYTSNGVRGMLGP
jgi:hypothetical protein